MVSWFWGLASLFWCLQDASQDASQYIMCSWLIWKWSWSQCLSYGMCLEVCKVCHAWWHQQHEVNSVTVACQHKPTTTAVRWDVWNLLSTGRGTFPSDWEFLFLHLFFLRNIEKNKLYFKAFVITLTRCQGLGGASEIATCPLSHVL